MVSKRGVLKTFSWFSLRQKKNAYFLAKFRFDTAENEPAKNLQILLILLFCLWRSASDLGARRPSASAAEASRKRTKRNLFGNQEASLFFADGDTCSRSLEAPGEAAPRDARRRPPRPAASGRGTYVRTKSLGGVTM